MAAEKGDGLGVLDSYRIIVGKLRGMEKDLRARDQARAIKDARNAIKDLMVRLDKSQKDGRLLRKTTKGIVNTLNKRVLPLIHKPPAKGTGARRGR